MTSNVLHSSNHSQWLTPEPVINLVRQTLGSIDLDPASCDFANQIVQATRFYDGRERGDGLKEAWNARTIFLNPPYSKKDGGPAGLWVRRALVQHAEQAFSKGILLLNATTDRLWFHELWRYPICFFYKRIHFYTFDGAPQSPTHGNCAVLLPGEGGDVERFHETFDPVGHIVLPRSPAGAPL